MDHRGGVLQITIKFVDNEGIDREISVRLISGAEMIVSKYTFQAKFKARANFFGPPDEGVKVAL